MTLRFALLADVHGNLEALDAVLAEVDALAPDAQLVCAGDVVGYGPDPDLCLSRLEERRALLVRGNHEELVLGLRDLSECVHAGIVGARFARRRLSQRALLLLDSLPSSIDASPDLVVCHGDLERRYVREHTRARRSGAPSARSAKPERARARMRSHAPRDDVLTHRRVPNRAEGDRDAPPEARNVRCESGLGRTGTRSGAARALGAPRLRDGDRALRVGRLRLREDAREDSHEGLVSEVAMPPVEGFARTIARAKKRWALSFSPSRLPRPTFPEGKPYIGDRMAKSDSAPLVVEPPPRREHAVTPVIVTYNSGRFIDGALATMKASHEAGLVGECFVVDNESADDTCEVVRTSHAWATLIESGGNIGFGRGANLGIERARSPYVLLLNPDATLPLPDLEHLVSILDSNPRAGAVAPAIRQSDGQLQFAGGLPTPESLILDALLYKKRDLGDRRTIEPGVAPFRTTWLCGAVVLLRRSMLDHIGAFDPRYFLYFEETDLFRRANLAGWELWATGEAVATHAQGASARTVKRDLYEGCVAEHFYRSRFQYLESHFGWPRAASAEIAELGVFSARAALDTLRGRDIARYRTRFRAPVFGLRTLAEPVARTSASSKTTGRRESATVGSADVSRGSALRTRIQARPKTMRGRAGWAPLVQ